MKSTSRSRFAAVAIVALAACLAAPAAQAQWKWRDKSGQTHVSDLPPPREIPEKDVLQRPSDSQRRAPPPAVAPASAPASAADTPTPPRVDPELEARRKRAEQEQAAQRKQADDRVAADRAENCRRAQAQLRSLDSGMRLARVNEKGEREIMDDKQRAEEMQRARGIVASDCK